MQEKDMMNLKKTILQPRAENDLEEIWLYTAFEWGTKQAEVYIAKLYEAIYELELTYRFGVNRFYISEGLRSYKAKKHLIFYYEDETEIIVVAVLHEKIDFNGVFF